MSKSNYESDEDDVPLSARKKFKVKRKTPDSEDEDIKPVCDLSMCQFDVLNAVDNYNSRIFGCFCSAFTRELYFSLQFVYKWVLLAFTDAMCKDMRVDQVFKYKS